MNRKWTLFSFSPGDYKGVEAYLNRQAAKGWELEKVTGIIARWKRADRPSRWCVDLLNARADRADKLDYLDLCAEGGWELVALLGSMCIFRSEEGKSPFPVQTDPKLEKRNYKKYYFWPAILSVLYMALLLGAIVLIVYGAAREGAALAELRWGWAEHWTYATAGLSLPVWGVMALWKIVHFFSSQVRNRRGVTAPPPAAMWINSVLALASTLMGLLVLLGLAADNIFGNTDNRYLFILLGVDAAILLYRSFSIEQELFRGERRRNLIIGLVCLILLGGLIVGTVAPPYKTWPANYRDEEAMAKYDDTFDLPIVHGEDVGVPLERGRETVYITRAQTPLGERWELEYVYGEEKATFGYLGTGSITVLAPTQWQAKQAAAMLAEGSNRGRHDFWPPEGLTPLTTDWADEAWHCRWATGKAGGQTDALVLRMGTRVIRVIFPAEQTVEELLDCIRAVLTK